MTTLLRNFSSRFLVLLFLSVGTYVHAQSRRVDSLSNELEKANPDSTRLKILLNLSFEIRASQPEKAERYAMEALEIAKRTYDKKKIAKAYSNIGLTWYYRSEYDKAIAYYDSSLSTALSNADFPGISLAYNQIGNTYKAKNNLPLAIEYHKKALNIRRNSTDTMAIAQSYLNLGNTYVKNCQYDLALSNFLNALDLAKNHNKGADIAGIYNGIGNVYLYQKNPIEALNYYRLGYFQSVRSGDDRGMYTFSMNVGNSHMLLKNYDSAFYYLNTSVELVERTQNKSGLGEIYITMSIFFEETKRFDKAIEFSKKACDVYSELGLLKPLTEARLHLAEQFLLSGNKVYGEKYLKEGMSALDSLKDNQDIFIIYQKIGNCYHLLGNNDAAFQYMQQALNIRDSLYTANNIEAITQMQSAFDIKTKENEIELLNKEAQLRDSRIGRQQTIIISLIGSAFLFVLLVFFVYRGYKRTKTANNALSRAYREINEKNKSISDSIQYARNIQNALLKLPGSFDRLMGRNYFILYKPKDVVSGDFYWIEEFEKMILIAAADCTGHGVPGSLMSMLGIEKLKQAVREKGLTDPGEILAFANRSFKDTLTNTGNENTVRDGMDIALCCIAAESDKVKYAGANRPLWILNNKKNPPELIEIAPTKAAIGGFTDESQIYKQHELLVEDGNIVYLFTDGFADQFGGEQNKKFYMKRFRELLPTIAHLSMADQKKALDKAFDEWKGDNEQVDDVLVIGLKNSKV